MGIDPQPRHLADRGRERRHDRAVTLALERPLERRPKGTAAWLVAVAVLSATAAGLAQPPVAQPAARVEPGLVIEAVGFCSETRPRTSNARLTWRAAEGALGAGVASLSATTQRLEVTVFKNGFDKGLFVALPIGAGAANAPVAAVTQSAAAEQLRTRRAFQIRLTGVNTAREAATADVGEMEAVVENLEPGVTYTWRLAVETPGGRLLSRTVTLRAPICPTDGGDSPSNTTRPRRQP